MCEGDHAWLEKHLDKRVSNLGDKVKDSMTYKKKELEKKCKEVQRNWTEKVMTSIHISGYQ